MNSPVPSEAKVVIVGGGIIGCSVAYHLARLGWKDIVLLEQNQLAGGTTWHAAGLIGRLRTSNSMTKINKYSAELYASLEKETGHSTGWKQVGSLIVARSEDRMIQLRRTAAMAELFGVEVQLIAPKAALEKWPLLRIDDVLGAAWLPHDGKVIPKEVALALAKGAEARGVRVLENVRVIEVLHRKGRVSGVRVASGASPIANSQLPSAGSESQISNLKSQILEAEFVVLCGGMWARQLGLACGVNLPLYPVEHHYVVSAPISGAFDELPVGRDPDLCLYFRGEGNGVMLGAFQKYTKPWLSYPVPDRFSYQLLEADWEKFSEPLQAGQWRIPALAGVKFEKFVNGPESFTPDNNFLMGETPELQDLFVAAGFNSVGIASAGGAGKYLAEWMSEGQPTMDLWSVDVRRFAPFANNLAFLRERVTEVLGLHYQPAWPNREFETGRGLRKSALHDRLAAQGACFGCKNGWERPNWFARRNDEPTPAPLPGGELARDVPPGSSPPGSSKEWGHNTGAHDKFQKYAEKPVVEYSFSRQNWFANQAFEHRAARENVALFDQSGFSKYMFRGRDVVQVLQRLCGNDIDIPMGRAVYTGLFNERGGFESDLTLIRIAADEYYVVSGSAQTTRDLDWIRRNLREPEHAEIVDVTEAYAVLGLMGPNSRALLGRLTEADLGNEAFLFCTAQTISVGPATVRAVRITYVGELGWELHVPASQATLVYDALREAGGDLGLINAGHYAINSLRLEKGYRAWGADISPDDTPLEAGLGFAIAWNKPTPFIGREALVEQKKNGVKRRLVVFVLQNPDPTLWGSEPIFRDGQPVGYTTSGSYGHTVGGAVGMGYVNSAAGVTDDSVRKGRFEIEVNGKRYPASAHLRAPYDPERKRILGQQTVIQ
ncbi:MAG: FAD-dependent oxidoreductase [Verrucomicrobia bacterium]|nr:FAD-dependent oxidoreductase [Verrucomicrobiota bacterium]